MDVRILLTSTSFIDTPGPHRELLQATHATVVTARGPLPSTTFLETVTTRGPFDAVICGEDQIDKAVLTALAPTCKVVSKYGVGLDKIDLAAAEEVGIKVKNTPGSNHTTVTELTFGLLLALARRIPQENEAVHRADWRRMTGLELAGKTIAVLGFGRVGKEVAKRALCFGMKVIVYNSSWNAQHEYSLQELAGVFSHPLFSEFRPSITRAEHLEDALQGADILTLHMSLNESSRELLNRKRLLLCRQGALIINVSRGALVATDAIAAAIKSQHIGGYAADVLEPQPVTPDNPLLGLENVILTPHIGSRTRESIARQGLAAVRNVIETLEGR